MPLILSGYALFFGVILIGLLWATTWLAPRWRHLFRRPPAGYFDLDQLAPFEDLIDGYLIDRYGCVSAFAEIEAPAADVASVGQLNQLQSQLCQLIDRVPEYIVQLQFIYSTSGSYQPLIQAHPTLQSEWPVAQMLRELRSERLLQESKNRRLVRANTLLVLTCSPRPELREGAAILHQLKINFPASSPLPRRLLRPVEFSEAVHTLKSALAGASDSLERVGARLRPLPNREVAAYYYQLFNPDLALDQAIPLNFEPESTPFSDAWLCGEVALKDDCLRWGSYYHAVVGMNAKPQQSSPRLIESLTTGLPFHDFRVTLQIRRLDKSREVDALKRQRIVSVGKRRSSINPLDAILRTETPAGLAAEENVEASDEVREQNELISELRAGKTNLTQVQLVVHFWHPDRTELNRRREILLARFHDMNQARGWHETASTLPVLINSLPACYEPLEHPSKVKDRMAADLIPLHKGFEGGDHPVSLFRNATGGLVTLDLFSHTDVDASMSFVSGATGSGKSFLVNQLLLQHLVGRPLLLILDVGGSYESLVQQLNGQVVSFHPENPRCLNPLQIFRPGGSLGEPDEASRARILLNVEALATQPTDPLGELPPALRNLIDLAVVQAFAHAATRRDPVVTLSHLVERLNRFGPEGHALIERLKPFLRGEVFGAWFDGPSELDLRSPVVCFDLKGIRKVPVLARALIPMMVNYCYDRILASRGLKKILLFEEMWDFITNPKIAQFIVESYKTFRKEGAAVIGVSQSLADITRNEVVASALLQNVQTWFLLDQGNPDNERLAVEKLNLTQGQAEILTSLRRQARILESGEIQLYRECLLVRGQGRRQNSGRLRIAPMPEESWLSTTLPEEILERERVTHQCHGDLGQAIQSLARRHPGGLFIKKSD
jgi:hypothetical protein